MEMKLLMMMMGTNNELFCVPNNLGKLEQMVGSISKKTINFAQDFWGETVINGIVS